MNSDKPYNDLPLIPPKVNLETKVILKQLNASNKALAELRGYSETIPNKDILINSIILKESKDSSEIENIVTTHDTLYKALVTNLKEIDPQTKEVLNYKKALWSGFEAVKKHKLITTNHIIQIQKELEQNDAGIRKLPGTALKNEKTDKIIYTPPDGEDNLRRLLKNLEDYINLDDDIDPLIKLPVIHYQFESIHPFYDGNGRTGRIINVLFLIVKDLLDSPILYLSRYIIKNKPTYYSLLQEVRTEDKWEEWILYMLKAVEETSKETLQLIKDIRTLMDKTMEKVKKESPKIYSKELVELLFHNPYARIDSFVKKLNVTRKTASYYFGELEKISVVEEKKIGRDRIYIIPKLFNLLRK